MDGMMTPAVSLSFANSKALHIDSCRYDVQRAAVAKVLAGKNLSIKQCLLNAGFAEEQANNRTMQMRVRRGVQKLTREQATPKEKTTAAVSRLMPTSIETCPIEDDEISVLTEPNGMYGPGPAPGPAPPTTKTPALLPPAVVIPNYSHSTTRHSSPVSALVLADPIVYSSAPVVVHNNNNKRPLTFLENNYNKRIMDSQLETIPFADQRTTPYVVAGEYNLFTPATACAACP
jgi:hypothetical protein